MSIFGNLEQFIIKQHIGFSHFGMKLKTLLLWPNMVILKKQIKFQKRKLHEQNK